MNKDAVCAILIEKKSYKCSSPSDWLNNMWYKLYEKKCLELLKSILYKNFKTLLKEIKPKESDSSILFMGQNIYYP